MTDRGEFQSAVDDFEVYHSVGGTTSREMRSHPNPNKLRPPHPQPSPGGADRAYGQWILIAFGLGFLLLLVVFPLLNILYQAFASGWAAYGAAVTTAEARHAITMTVIVTACVVPINTVFGVLIAWLLAHHRFPGKVIVLGLIDLPISVSPVVVGMLFILVYSQTTGLFGPWLRENGIRVIFALPSLVLVTLFVTFPFVIREVLPVLQAQTREEEEAALTLGANGWQVFWRVTLPSIRPAIFHGIILCTARAVGEFGAVSVVSGKVIGRTNTLTLHVERVYGEYQTTAAFAAASLLALIALVALGLQLVSRPKAHSG